MILIQTEDLYKSYVVDPVLSGVDFEVQSGERIGLIGRNGSGKSTLMQILAGHLAYDQGQVHRARELSIGYLEQTPSLSATDQSIYEYCLEAYRDLLDLRAELFELTQRIAQAPHDEELQSQYAQRQQHYDDANGYAIESKVRGILQGLGFPVEAQEQTLRKLSGGERTRLELAKLLSREVDLLLLDEPTNHLDISAITWLESYLSQYPGAVVIITHDRVFLDRTIQKIFELEAGVGHWYQGNYTGYVAQKRIRYEQQLHQHAVYTKKRQAEEAKLREFQQRSHSSAKFSARARDRERKLARMEVVAKPLWLDRQLQLDFEPQRPSGHQVLKVRDLSKGFSGRSLFQGLSFDLFRGDILGIAGPNGIGKTTLLRLLTQALPPDSGEFFYGSRVDWGYYDQSLSELDPENDLVTEINHSYPSLDQGSIRNLLASFLFTGESVFKPIKSLSGGEKARLALLKLMLAKKNLLLLDEPTNHLDLASKETLEVALKDFSGTLIFVSHDRYFLNQLCTKILWLDHDGHRLIAGNYDDLSDPNAQELKPAPDRPAPRATSEPAPKQPAPTRSDTDRLRELLLAERELELELELLDLEDYNESNDD